MPHARLQLEKPLDVPNGRREQMLGPNGRRYMSQ